MPSRGITARFTGHPRHVTGHARRATGHQLHVTGHLFRVTGHLDRCPENGTRISGHPRRVTGHQRRVTGHPAGIRGHRGGITGRQDRMAGIRHRIRGDGARGNHVTARTAIAFAYNANRRQIIGGPDWIHSLTLRTLLADRFALRVRRETREMPVHALVRARPGFTPGERHLRPTPN